MESEKQSAEKVSGQDENQAIAAKLARLARFMPLLLIGNLLVGVPALLMSMAVAYATFVQAEATQKMQQAGAWPYISYGTSNVGDDGESKEISLVLTNNGVGPAMMGPIELKYQGKVMRSRREFLQSCCGLRLGSGVSFTSSPSSEIVIRAGANSKFLVLERRAENKDVWDKLDRERWKLQVRSCYCSIFEECWVIDGPRSKPQPVEQCPTDWLVLEERPTP